MDENKSKPNTSWQSPRSPLSNDTNFSSESQKLTKIWSWQKKFQKVRRFLSATIYIYTHPKKMFPPLKTLFSFEHIFIISWVWVKNLILLESWYSKLFHGGKIFFVFWRFFELLIFEQKSCIFYHIKKYHFSSSYQKKFFFVKTSSCIDYFARKFLEKNVGIDNHMMVWIWVWFSDK